MNRIIRASGLAIAAAVLGLAPQAHAQDKPCMADAARLCPGVKPGEAQIACLKEHKQELSTACKQKIVEKKEQQELKKEEQQPPAPPKQQEPPPQP